MRPARSLPELTDLVDGTTCRRHQRAPVQVAHMRHLDRELGNLHDFEECVGHHVWFFLEGWVDLHVAVDNLWRLAERWQLLDDLGPDRVQEIIARPFAVARGGK